MDLTVIIVSYNVSSFLDQTLMTVEESAQGIEHEVFVVDNASADDSADMVRRKYPQVKLIENKDNLGFAKANNQALKLAKGRYILLLNPDTVLRADTIPAMIGFLDSHPEAGAAGCKVINPDGSLQLACRRGFPSPGVAFFKMVGLSGLFPKSRTFGAYNLTYLDPEAVAEVDAISGSFMMLRRETLDRAGYLDEDYFMYGEDLDICFRIKKDGWKIYYVPETEIIHFKGESTKSVPSVKSILDFYTAMHIFVEKHHGGGTKLFPRWLLFTGIYFRMALGYGIRTLTKLKEPLIDFFLINISLALGVMMRFGVSVNEFPEYTGMQWISIFLVYSTFYIGTFTFLGMYHRYRHNPERAFLGVFIGFLLNVLIVYFIKEYNFSRIASFYCWGFNTIFISGWRFALQMMHSKESRSRFKKAIVVGRIDDAAAFRKMVSFAETAPFFIIGCVEVTPGALRGREKDGVYVLGLVDELHDIIKEYAADMVIMVGSSLPYSKILSIGSKFGSMTPEFKLAPELKAPGENSPHGAVTLIDIHPGGLFGNGRR
jgi:O-antigen biosynthesis protein